MGTGLCRYIVLLVVAGGLFTATPAAPAAALRHEPRTRTLELADLDEAFRTLAEAVAPSVVAISAVRDLDVIDQDGRPLTGEGLDALLGRRLRVVGTGFCVDSAGYILTNQHVIAGAERLFCTTDDGRVLPAIVLGSDPRNDLAVLKVPAELPAVTFSDTPAERGQWCVALGNPLGIASLSEMSMSVGVVSATGRTLPKLSREQDRLYHDLIQTTAEVNPGNSGGPLFDLEGRVIGLVTAVVLPHGNSYGMGFALPVRDRLTSQIARLKLGLPLETPDLGITVRNVPGDGVRVTDIGETALHRGDIIRRLAGETIVDADALGRRVLKLAPRGEVDLDIERDGERLTERVMVAVAPAHHEEGVAAGSRRLLWEGVTFGPVPGHWAKAGVTEGVLIASVRPDSPHAAELAAGEVVTAIGDMSCRSLADLQRALFEAEIAPTLMLSTALP